MSLLQPKISKNAIDLVLASVLASVILLGTYWAIHSYSKTYRSPVQNRLPQGSFLADESGLPMGWKVVGGEVRLKKERTNVHAALSFVRLDGRAADATISTEIPLDEGWRALHLSAWSRTAEENSGGSLFWHFKFLDEEGKVIDYSHTTLPVHNKSSWTRTEQLREIPIDAERLGLVVECHEGVADIAEFSLVPKYRKGLPAY